MFNGVHVRNSRWPIQSLDLTCMLVKAGTDDIGAMWGCVVILIHSNVVRVLKRDKRVEMVSKQLKIPLTSQCGIQNDQGATFHATEMPPTP